MQKLNLCHLSLATYPDRKDGASKFARRIYDELKNRGHNIVLLTAKWENGFDDPNIITIDIPKSRFLWVPKFAWTFKKYLQSHEFDIIHSNGSRASIPIMLAKKPFISHIHDVGPFQTNFSPLPFLKWIEKKNARDAKRILTCAESNRQEIQHFMGADIQKIHTVLDAIDPIFKPDPKRAEELKSQLGINGKILYYVGRIEFYKGIDDILKAYKKAKDKVPELNLVIGGKAAIGMQETIEQWKYEYPEVKFVGMVPDEDMSGFYSMADAFVTYSFASEGFGLTPVEALACGTPVIASALPAYQNILQNSAMFVEPKRADLLAETFVNYFQNPDLKKNMLKNAEPLLKQYTWKNVVDNIEKVYADYLNDKK